MPPSSSSNNNNNNSSSSALWHGLGLFGESYLLFSIGTLRPLWEALYPLCFSSDAQNSTCPHAYLTYNSLSYSVVLGVMAGMIIVGILAGQIGRRKGSLLTASIMVGGASILVLASWLLSINGRPDILFMVMSASLFVFGIGVGGEYPLSATLASERAMMAMRERRRVEEKEGDGKSGMLSSRLLTVSDTENGTVGAVDHDEGNGGGSSSSKDHYSWQTTRQDKLTHIEQYNVTQQQPQSSSSGQVQHSSNNDIITHKPSKTLTRGREVIVVFSMQGMGILANSLILTFLLMITKQKGQQQQQQEYYNDDEFNQQQQENGNDDTNYNNNFYSNQYHSDTSLLYTWRIIYAIGLGILIYVLISRIRHLNESEVWTQDRLKRDQDELQRRQQMQSSNGGRKLAVNEGNGRGGGFVPPSIFPQVGGMNEVNGNGQCKEEERQSELQLLFQHYGIRLFGTSITWLLWDIAFYGNKLFQSTFLLALTGENATLTQISGASALNALVALLGYYAAALIVDKPTIGRLRLQQTGFIITGTLFLICGFLSEQLSSTVLVMIYLGSSFFGQCGPNCTTFLIPAEVFPTEMRTVCHGISASAGKLGALIASILFTFAKTDKSLFLISGYTSFAAAVVTFLTIPDLTTLDLYEIDKHWRMILNGNEQDYVGAAVDSKHLSYLERQKHR